MCTSRTLCRSPTICICRSRVIGSYVFTLPAFSAHPNSQLPHFLVSDSQPSTATYQFVSLSSVLQQLQILTPSRGCLFLEQIRNVFFTVLLLARGRTSGFILLDSWTSKVKSLLVRQKVYQSAKIQNDFIVHLKQHFKI